MIKPSTELNVSIESTMVETKAASAELRKLQQALFRLDPRPHPDAKPEDRNRKKERIIPGSQVLHHVAHQQGSQGPADVAGGVHAAGDQARTAMADIQANGPGRTRHHHLKKRGESQQARGNHALTGEGHGDQNRGAGGVAENAETAASGAQIAGSRDTIRNPSPDDVSGGACNPRQGGEESGVGSGESTAFQKIGG